MPPPDTSEESRWWRYLQPMAPLGVRRRAPVLVPAAALGIRGWGRRRATANSSTTMAAGSLLCEGKAARQCPVYRRLAPTPRTVPETRSREQFDPFAELSQESQAPPFPPGKEWVAQTMRTTLVRAEARRQKCRSGTKPRRRVFNALVEIPATRKCRERESAARNCRAGARLQGFSSAARGLF